MLGRLKIKFPKQRWILLVAVGAAVGTLGLYLFLYRPLLRELKIQSSAYRELEANLAHARQRIARLKRGGEERSFTKEEEVTLAIDELTRQGKLKEINFISITPKSIEKSKDARFQILPLEVETESSYETLGRFLGSLDDLEASLMTVAGFNVTAKGEDPSRLRACLILHMCVAS